MVKHKSILHALKQTKNSEADVEQHSFQLSATHNILNAKIQYVPTVMISLAHANSIDRHFVPFIDSCGQGAHQTREQAFNAALNEFIERQALIGAWLSGKNRFKILLQAHIKFGKFNHLLQALQKNGEVMAFDIGNNLPCYSVIIFYFSKAQQDVVQYSVGMATDFDPALAIQKALNELWQSYMFIYLNANNPECLDQRYRYLNELLNYNHQATKDIIPFLKSEIELSVEDYLKLNIFNNTARLAILNNLSREIFSYERTSYLYGTKIYLCKILSPDFFLHMGVMMPLNLDNYYARSLNINSNLSITHSIPFP